MDEMLRTEREIPKTVIREQEKPHAEALRANAIYDALIERRANWYQKYRPNLEAVPEVKREFASRYRRDTIRLIEAVKTPVEFLQDLERKKYKTEESKKRTIARWKKKCDLAIEVLQEKFAGEGVALSGGKAPVREAGKEKSPPPITPEIAPEPERKLEMREAAMPPPVIEVPPEEEVELPPVEALEKRRFDLGQMWEGVIERFKIRIDLNIGERIKALGKPLSTEEMEEVERKRKAAAGARKETLVNLRERTKVVVLPTAEAAKDWIGQMWAKASIPSVKPLTKEESEAGLEAQKVKVKLPRFKEIPLKEAWKKADPKTRWAMGITAGVAVAVGAGVVYCRITGTSGQEIYQAVSSGISGASEAIQELLTKIPTPGKEVVSKITSPPHTADILREEVGPLREWVKPATEVVKPVAEVISHKAEAARWTNLAEMMQKAIAAKEQLVQTATEQVRQAIQTGIEIAKGSHSWGAAETAAKQVIKAAGVQSDPERLSILTDAINKAGGLPDLVQPGTKLMLRSENTVDILAKAIEKTSQVIAHGGAEGLKVPADQEDLQALTRVVEFLKSFK